MDYPNLIDFLMLILQYTKEISIGLYQNYWKIYEKKNSILIVWL